MNPERERTLAQGLVAGFLGYLVVVAFYAVFNVATGRPLLLTAELLGRALLGESAIGATGVDPAPIAVYNGLHLVVFLAIGFAAAWLVHETERHPALWYLILFLGVFVFFHLFGAVAAFAAPTREAIPLWTVLAASLLAAVAIGTWLWRTHPGLAHEVRRAGDLEDLPPG